MVRTHQVFHAFLLQEAVAVLLPRSIPGILSLNLVRQGVFIDLQGSLGVLLLHWLWIVLDLLKLVLEL